MSKKSTMTFDESIHEVINPDFMGMSPEDLKDFDAAITKLEQSAAHDLKKAPLRKNDAYLRDDIFNAEEKGGESE